MELREAAEDLLDSLSGVYSIDEIVGWSDVIVSSTALRTALASQQDTQPPWVSVEERLPQDPAKVLVWYEPAKSSPHALMAWFSGGDWRFIDNHAESRLVERVTHWIPIPAAPQTDPKGAQHHG